MTDKEKQFILELTALTRKHGIAIWGCGCCGSPHLKEVDVSDEAGYCLADRDQELTWVQPSDAYNWKLHAEKIVREDVAKEQR